jgi:hypothetical protein
MSSGPFTTSVLINFDNLKVEGETKVYTSTRTSTGLPSHGSFCPNCGTMMYGIAESNPGKVAVRTGVLEDGGLSKYVPTIEICAESKATWLAPQEGTMVFLKMPNDI